MFDKAEKISTHLAVVNNNSYQNVRYLLKKIFDADEKHFMVRAAIELFGMDEKQAEELYDQTEKILYIDYPRLDKIPHVIKNHFDIIDKDLVAVDEKYYYPIPLFVQDDSLRYHIILPKISLAAIDVYHRIFASPMLTEYHAVQMYLTKKVAHDYYDIDIEDVWIYDTNGILMLIDLQDDIKMLATKVYKQENEV